MHPSLNPRARGQSQPLHMVVPATWQRICLPCVLQPPTRGISRGLPTHTTRGTSNTCHRRPCRPRESTQGSTSLKKRVRRRREQPRRLAMSRIGVASWSSGVEIYARLLLDQTQHRLDRPRPEQLAPHAGGRRQLLMWVSRELRLPCPRRLAMSPIGVASWSSGVAACARLPCPRRLAMSRIGAASW